MKHSSSNSNNLGGALRTTNGETTVLDNPELREDIEWSDFGENMQSLAALLGVQYQVVVNHGTQYNQQQQQVGTKAPENQNNHCTGCRAVVHHWQKRCKICDRANPHFKAWAKPPS